jgi:hypothetical protein
METRERPKCQKRCSCGQINRDRGGVKGLAPRCFAIVDQVIERCLSGNSWRGRISITIRRYAQLIALLSGMPTDGEF